MKLTRWAQAALACLFFAGLLSGCGVSQKKYENLLSEKIAFEEKCDLLARANDALKNEYDNLLKEKMDIATQLGALTNEKKAMKDEYDKILGEKITLKTSYDKMMADNKALKDKLTAAGIKIE